MADQSSGTGSSPLGYDESNADYEYSMPSDDESDVNVRPAIILMGLRRSGKTSIRKVVFQKMSPNETLFVESTTRVTVDSIKSSFIDFDTKEFPGQMSPFDPALDPNSTFGHCGAVIFVIDPMEDTREPLRRLNEYVIKAYRINPHIKFEVFIHKVDGLPDDNKMDIQREIYQKANEDLVDAGYDQIHLSFNLTSIYDHSIFEAFSKVVQKLIPQLPTLENLLCIFNKGSMVEKSFLFDLASKIYVATDGTPVHMQTYELCCDMIDVVLDITSIYSPPSRTTTENKDTSADANTQCTIRLSTNQVLYLRQVNRYLALVSIIRAENFEKQGLIEHNFGIFKSAIGEVFKVRAKMLERQRRQIAAGMSPSTVLNTSHPPPGTRRLRRNSSDVTLGSDQQSSRS